MSVIRLSKVVKDFNVSLDRIADFLEKHGIVVEHNPNSKIDDSVYELLMTEFGSDKAHKMASESVIINKITAEKKQSTDTLELPAKKAVSPPIESTLKKSKEKEKEKDKILPEVGTEINNHSQDIEIYLPAEDKKPTLKVLGKIELPDKKTTKTKKIDLSAGETTKTQITESQVDKTEISFDQTQKDTLKTTSQSDIEEIKTQYRKLEGPNLTGEKIDLSIFEKKPTPVSQTPSEGKKKRKRIHETRPQSIQPSRDRKSFEDKQRLRKERPVSKELSEEEIKNQIKSTLEKLTGKGTKSKAAKYRREKRIIRRENEALEQELSAADKTLKVTEFITVNELASLMDVSATDVISACFSLGLMVTMNQRLDADTITLVADEFGYSIQFIDAELEESNQDEQVDREEDLLPRPPIVTVMGHVDHGKTSLLDYIRKTNVIAGESGGITQHIGAYSVTLDNGQKITFLDTPGHEAFTAMRARGAQVTDIAIIVIAADDGIMPQTKEAISHAQAAGVPMIIAINKVDKPDANPDKIREQLSQMNILVEEWGGKVQSQEISAKFGNNVDLLLEKVLLEAELLNLRANPNKLASGVVIEASLDKGRGYVTTALVQSGTLRQGDYVLAGKHHGKVRAMLDERGHPVKEAGPSTPITILGLDGAPTAGDKFKVYEDEREAKQIATRREQLLREQALRTHKHITLDELGRRIALGDFKELNIILKGDVDGSVEALTDSLLKLSTPEIHINILHRGVGQISESDVLLASASDAIIIGFNVRANNSAKEIAEREQIEIRYYSIIYDAINDVKEAIEGMLSPEIKEQVIGLLEVRETFRISKVGTVAGCMVLSGKVHRNAKIRVLREGIVIHTGELESLKRFKDDVKEVAKGYECGLNIKNFNDIQIGDQLEVYEEIEVRKKLK